MLQSKNLLCRLSFAFCFICCLLIVQGCGDDDEPKDTTAPEISFAGLTADSQVWNTVSIAVDATDDLGISTVEFFVDGSLIATLNEAPFETSWDSNLVADGSHTVGVVVTDKSGNKTEKSISLIVQNALVTIDIAVDQLYKTGVHSERGFVFLSNEDGDLIVSQEYTNGNPLTLKSPAFNGEHFYLTEVLAQDDGENTYVLMWTYPAIERGQRWVLMNTRENNDEDYAGEAKLIFENAAPGTIYHYSVDGNYGSISETTATENVLIRNSPSMFYIQRSGAYALFPEITVGDNAIDLAQVNKPLKKIIKALPPLTSYASVEIYGYPQAGVYTSPYPVGYSTTSSDDGINIKLEVSYPDTAFPSYFSILDFETEKFSYEQGSNNKILEIRDLESTVSMRYENATLNYSASGAFDFMTVQFESESRYSVWFFVLPKGDNQKIQHFVLPDEIKAFDIATLGQPEEYVIYDFDGLENYNDLKSFIRGSSNSADDLYDPGDNYLEIRYKNPASTGGRMRASKENHPFRGSNLR